MGEQFRPLTTLRFDGPRFQDHGLEIDVLTELIAYKEILLETAKERWRETHPDRDRLPKGFEDAVAIKFFEIRSGSTEVPLMRRIPAEGTQGLLGLEDDLDAAADLIEAAIASAADDRPLPDYFPKAVIPLFEEFGKRLAEDESIVAKGPRSVRESRYTREVRNRLMNWIEATYEDVVNLAGEVRAADLDGRNFVLRKDDGEKVSGKFSPDQEPLITEALHDHSSRRLRVQGLAEFSRSKGVLRRILRVDKVHVLDPSLQEYDTSARPIWEVAVELGASISDADWDRVPKDLSRNLDQYLYPGELPPEEG